MYEIVERYSFTATHRIPDPAGCHSDATVHLHRWTADVTLAAATLPSINRPCELIELEPVRHHIAWELDGKCLNDVLSEPPTPARLVEHLMDWCVANLAGYARVVLHSITISIDSRSSVRRIAPTYLPEQ